MVKIIKRVSTAFIAVIMLVSFCFTAFASADDTPKADSSVKVHDYAGLFTDDEVSQLESRAQRIMRAQDIDTVIVTTSDLMGKSYVEYADDFFDYNGYGIGAKNSGILYLIDMYSRNIYISTSGKAIRIFTDHNIDYILDSVSFYMQDGYYASSASVFLDKTEEILGDWPQYQLKIRLFSFAGGIAVSIIIIAVMWYTMHKSSQPKAITARHYIPNGAIKITGSNDRFVNTYTSRIPIPKDNGGGSGGGGGSSFSGGSSSHTSSSGSSHGGGGRSF